VGRHKTKQRGLIMTKELKDKIESIVMGFKCYMDDRDQDDGIKVTKREIEQAIFSVLDLDDIYEIIENQMELNKTANSRNLLDEQLFANAKGDNK